MNIIDFINHFSDRESRELYLKEHREKSGIRCKSITKHYWFSGGKFFECSCCRRRSSLKSGTLMEKSKLPLHTWLLAFMLMAATKMGFSCLKFQRQLGLSRYDTAFRMMYEIRAFMGKRDSLFTPTDMVEYDECYVGVATKKQVKKKLKRGKGSQQKALVAVSAVNSGESGRVWGYHKMEVLRRVDGEHVNQFIKKNADGDIVLFTDKKHGLRPY